jgi:predicted RNA-binding Zn-ribbon protein involved in translation (DUF1610 family)
MKERDGPMQKAGKSLGMAHRAKLLRVLYLDKYGIEQERPDLELGLRYVYIANFPGHERENTYCPNCNGMVIARFGYDIHSWNLDNENRCKACGYMIPIVGGLTRTPPEERYVPVVFPPMDLSYVCEGPEFSFFKALMSARVNSLTPSSPNWARIRLKPPSHCRIQLW